MERTLGLIKPDAVAKQAFGPILSAVTEAGLKILAVKSLRLSHLEAAGFYAVHKDRPFFGELVEYMTSGPILAMVLEGDDAIRRWRDLMGPTDATRAPPETIRGRFGTSLQNNAVHGSDAPETAAFEIGYLFAGKELRVLTE
ncbi:MAG: nucleoside-diphosphate kinase [bacterium]